MRILRAGTLGRQSRQLFSVESAFSTGEAITFLTSGKRLFASSQLLHLGLDLRRAVAAYSLRRINLGPRDGHNLGVASSNLDASRARWISWRRSVVARKNSQEFFLADFDKVEAGFLQALSNLDKQLSHLVTNVVATVARVL